MQEESRDDHFVVAVVVVDVFEECWVACRQKKETTMLGWEAFRVVSWLLLLFESKRIVSIIVVSTTTMASMMIRRSKYKRCSVWYQ
jgi:hypothetical protein